MSIFPPAAASEPAHPSANGTRLAHARLLAMLEAVILCFLIRLPRRHARLLARGGDIPHTTLAAFAPDAPPHAPFVALGLVPDWIMPGVRNRGMRATPNLRPHARARPATRAPPRAATTPSAEIPLPPEGVQPRPL